MTGGDLVFIFGSLEVVRAVISLLAIVFVAGCLPTRAFVTEFNGASVKVTVPIVANRPNSIARADEEAQRICQRARKKAEFASSRMLENYSTERLYLCL